MAGVFAATVPGTRGPASSALASTRLRTWLATGAGAALLAYLAVRASQPRLAKLKTTLSGYSSMLCNISSVAALLTGDLQAYLASDHDELPRSLRQFAKLLQSQDVQDLLSSSAGSLGRGVATAVQQHVQAPADAGDPLRPGALDTILEAVLSDRGRSLVGMAVSLATKNATTTFCEFLERMQAGAGQQLCQAASPGAAGITTSSQAVSPAVQSALAALSSEHGQRVISLLITKSIRTAVSSYVEATTGYNVYDDMLKSISNREHRDAVADILSKVTGSFCRELVRAVQRSSSTTTTTGTNPVRQQGQEALPLPLQPACYVASDSSGVPASTLHSSSSCSSVISLEGHTATTSQLCPTQQGASAEQGTSIQGHAAAEVALRRRLSLDAACLLQHVGLPALQTPSYKPGSNSVTAGAGAAGRSGFGTAGGVKSVEWLLQPVVALVKERDVRSLAVEVVTSVVRESIHSTWDVIMHPSSKAKGNSSSSGTAGEGAVLRWLSLQSLAEHRLYVVLAVAMAVLWYVSIAAHGGVAA